MSSPHYSVQQLGQPSLHVQLGTTMSLRAAYQSGPPSPAYQPVFSTPTYQTGPSSPASHTAGQQAGSNDLYGKLPSFSLPLSGSSTININLPSPPPGKMMSAIRGPEMYTTKIPISPLSPPPPDKHSTSSMPQSSTTTNNTAVQTPPIEGPGFFPSQRHAGPTRVSIGPQAQAPATKFKPGQSYMRTGSLYGSVESSATSSGTGSMPSSPQMTKDTPVTGGFSRMALKPAEPELDMESLTWSSLDDTRSERSYNSSTGGADSRGDLSHDMVECDSACSVGSPDEEVEVVPTYDRVGIVCDERMAIMVQLACETDEGTSHEQFGELVAGVATACAQYFKKKEAEKEVMNATQVEQIIMADRRPVKEHLAEISQILNENVTITKADCRRVTSKGYVSTYVLENVSYKGRASVSKHGVIVTLKKLNKFACCKEFSEQLCLHILATRPEQLGKGELITTVENRKRPVNPKCLLTQKFYCDQTCNVYEAGKRSFVEVSDFVLY